MIDLMNLKRYDLTDEDIDLYLRTGWIPSRSGLPEPDERVLCSTVTKKGVKNLVIGYHDGTRWCCGMNSNVVYWMPLPDLPE